MKHEITQKLDLTPEQRRLLSWHSIHNILGVIRGTLELSRTLLDDEQLLLPGLQLCTEALERLGRFDDAREVAETLSACRKQIEEDLGRAREAVAGNADRTEIVARATRDLQKVFGVMEEHAAELQEREARESAWVPHAITQLESSLRQAFDAMVEHAGGRFGIVYHEGYRKGSDYLVLLDMRGEDGTHIVMPSVMHDCFRDLLANARKYTDPGGEIRGSLVDDGAELCVVVSDTGRGIPSREVAQVVRFGGRASNTRPEETRGGGYGLTKAYEMCRRYGGRLWIESEVDQGTTITLRIPRPA